MSATKLAAAWEGTRSLVEQTNTAGASIATASPHCGTCMLNLNTGAGPTEASVRWDNVMADAGRRLSVWFKTDTPNPAGGNPTILRAQTTGVLGVCTVELDTSGFLRARPVGGTTVVGTTTILANTWYRISWCYTITNTTVHEFRVYLNGVLEITASNSGTLTRTGSNQLECVMSTTFGASANCWFDDLYVDDGTDLADPGDLRCIAKLPIASGAVNTFDTTVGSGSGVGAGRSIYVNDRPTTATNQVRHNNTTTATENFAIEALTAGDKDISLMPLVARLAWIVASGVATDTVYDTAGAAVPSPVVSTLGFRRLITDASSWAASGSDVGMGRPSGNATDAILQDCGMIFIYRPVAILGVLSGTVTPVGTLKKTPMLVRGGTVTPTGVLSKLIAKTLTGSVTPTGALSKLIKKTLTGLVTPAGTIAATRVAVVLLTGLVTPVGTLRKMPIIVRGGTVTPVGTLRKLVSIIRSGSVTPSGILRKTPQIVRKGTVTPTGSIAGLIAAVARNAYKGGFAQAKRLSRGRGWW